MSIGRASPLANTSCNFCKASMRISSTSSVVNGDTFSASKTRIPISTRMIWKAGEELAVTVRCIESCGLRLKDPSCRLHPRLKSKILNRLALDTRKRALKSCAKPFFFTAILENGQHGLCSNTFRWVTASWKFACPDILQEREVRVRRQSHIAHGCGSRWAMRILDGSSVGIGEYLCWQNGSKAAR